MTEESNSPDESNYAEVSANAKVKGGSAGETIKKIVKTVGVILIICLIVFRSPQIIRSCNCDSEEVAAEDSSPFELYRLKYKDVDVAITKNSVQSQLYIERLEYENNALQKILDGDLVENDSLRTVIADMVKERLDDLNKARNLEKRVNLFFATNGKHKDPTLDQDLYNFISEKAHPNLRSDFVGQANSLAITSILSDKKTSDEEKNSLIADLNRRLDDANRALASSRDAIRSLQEQLAVANDSIESNSAFFSDSLLRMQALYVKLLHKADSLSEITNNTNPMRFDNLEFKPDGVPTRSDYTYKTGLIKKGLIVSFTINQNVTVESQKQDTVTVQYAYTINNTTYGPYDKVIPVGTPLAIPFNRDMAFPSGLYSVTLCCPYLKGKCITQSFQARKWTEKAK